MLKPLAVAVFATALLAACTDTADLAPMNETATQVGLPKFEFRRGLPHGPVTVTMPNGEILHGRFRVVDNTSFGFGFSGTTTAAAIRFGGSRAVFVSATGDQGTTITCQGGIDIGGHGGGVCETNYGARYQFIV